MLYLETEACGFREASRGLERQQGKGLLLTWESKPGKRSGNRIHEHRRLPPTLTVSLRASQSNLWFLFQQIFGLIDRTEGSQPHQCGFVQAWRLNRGVKKWAVENSQEGTKPTTLLSSPFRVRTTMFLEHWFPHGILLLVTEAPLHLGVKTSYQSTTALGYLTLHG